MLSWILDNLVFVIATVIIITLIVAAVVLWVGSRSRPFVFSEESTPKTEEPFAKPTREEANSMGLDQGRHEKLRLAQVGAGRTDRVHRMDAGWSLEAFAVVGLREDKKAGKVGWEG